MEMEMISREEAINYLKNNFIAIHCNSIYGWQYGKSFFDAEMDYTCYKSNGCLIIKYISYLTQINGEYAISNKPQKIKFNIHQISNESDVCAVWKYILENEKIENVKRTIIIYAGDPLPEETEIFLGFRKYVRKGEYYEDSCVRVMTKNDETIIKELCEDSITNDNYFGKREAETFYSWFEHESTVELLGIFNGNKLAGLVSVNRYDDVNMAQVGDLLIHKDYRRLGFGRRLVKSALNLYTDREYYYQAAKQNDASKELALSLGFKFAGAELWALDEE